MQRPIYQKLLALTLAFLLTAAGLTTLAPLTAKASDWDTENITDIYILPETTRSVTVSFHLGRNITHTDSGRLVVWLNTQDDKLLMYHDFDLDRIAIDNGTTVGNYIHTFKGLTSDTYFKVCISAREPGWSEATNSVTVKTPTQGTPVISLNSSWRTAASVRLKGEITDTGTGPGPYRYLAEELKSNALVIVPKAQEPAGNLSPSDPNAEVVFDEAWQEHNNAFEFYKEYFGLQPNTEYVAQAMLTNIYNNTGYSNKVYFTTFAYPQITLDQITPRSYDAYVYAHIELDTGDSLSSLGIYADDSDAQQPKDDPARISGSLVNYDDATNTAIFHLTGLTVNTTYDAQVFTRSGAGEKWSQRSTFTTLPAPTTATVETQAATSVRNTKALMNATIIEMGYSYVLEQGFVYSSVNANPRRGDPDAVEVTVPITSQTAPSAITALADGLTPDTTYYFQSFARNNVGSVYGGVLTFTTQNAPNVDTLLSTSDLTTSTVTMYGEVISTGGLSPMLRGFVYSESEAPVLGTSGVMSALDSVTDASTGQFDVTLSDLSAGTTYYYRAFIHSLQGTVYGDEHTFTTASVATILPAVTTNPIVVASITDNSAPVSGSFTTPMGTTVTETGFVYSIFPNPTMGDINTAFIPLTDTDGAFGTTFSALSSNTTYYVRAYAENENGYGYGGSISFTTKNEIGAVPPVIIDSMTVDEVTTSTITVTLSAPGAPAAGRYVLFSSTSTAPTMGAPGVNEASISIISGGVKTIEGLVPNTTYYLRGFTRNPDPVLGGYAEYYGDILAITTDAAGLPVITNGTPPIADITVDGALVHATIEPNGSTVTKTAVVFSSVTDTPAMGAGGTFLIQNTVYYDGETELTQTLSGLKSNTTYYYAVYAYNAEGWSCASVQSFTTDAAQGPVVEATSVTAESTTALITVQLTQDGEGDKAAFGVGLLVAAEPNPTFATPGMLIYWSSGAAGEPFTASVTGLTPSTQYYARAFVSTVNDETFLGASQRPFATKDPPLATVELYDPMNVTLTSADFTVSVLSNGGNPITERGIVWNTTGTPELYNDDKIVCAGAGTDPGLSLAQLSGLTEGTKYYVRAYAETVNGTAYSDELAFTLDEATSPPTAGNYMISVGFNHNVALSADGTVWCWGRGTEGQLGNGGNANSLTPVHVSGLTNVKYVAAGYDCSFAVKNDGTIWAWGYNQNGELGIGITTNSSVPVQIPGLSDVSEVSASYGLVNGSEKAGFALAVTGSGATYGWGVNNSKQVENSSSAYVSSPVQITALSDITQISAGYSAGTALKGDGSVWIWGYDWTMSGGGTSVRQVATLGADNVKVSMSCHLLALKSDGIVWSFGDNRYGQCGHDLGTNFVAPAAMSGVTNVADIETGNFLTVLRKNDGSVWSVGYNLSGEFGAGTYFIPPEEPNSTTLTESLIKSLIPAGTHIVQTSVVESTVAHILDDGSVWMNGNNINDKIGNGADGFGNPVITVHTPYMLPTINLLTDVSAMYTIAFNPNGGTCSTLTATTDTAGRLSSLPTAARSGYNFDGWYSAATGGTQVTTSTVFTSNTTIFAHWTYSGGSGGGGSSYEYYTITANAGIGGSISPSGSFPVQEGQDKTFTVSPDTGYIISDVLVDGESVGAVKTYTFENVSQTHTINAEFIKDDKLNPDTGTYIPFIDVTVEDWFVNSVTWAYEKGIMKGTSDTTFGPYDTTTRGMIVTILYRMEGTPATSSLSSFSDVAAGKYYADAVRWAATNGIVSAYGTELFGPNDNLTREQMVTILYNYAKYKGYDTTTMADLTGFTDAPQVSDWSSEAMRWAVGSGLIVGKGAGLLDPSGTSTRAEIATVIMRFCEMYLE